MYELGRGKWVFVDWTGIDPGYGVAGDGSGVAGVYLPRGVELEVGAPFVERDRVIGLDCPWESGETAYATFIEDEGLFRCWYEHGSGLGYAESDDGITWRKPALGGTTQNLLSFHYHGANVFKDPSAPAAERYKMVGCVWDDGERWVPGAVSPDGLQWTALPDPILPDQNADTQSIGLYDEALGQYVLYTRQRDSSTARRGVNRAATADFSRFPPSTPVLENDPGDPADWDLYCNGYLRWPGAVDAHVMRLSVYKRIADVVEVHLATSRDGHSWHRPEGRMAWIGAARQGLPWQQIYACAGILPTAAGEWSTYLGVTPRGHNDLNGEDTARSGIAVARVREDGFTYLASEGPGEFWTVPFELQATEIRVNYRARFAGFVRCEIEATARAEAEEAERVAARGAIAGFALEDCDGLTGDEINGVLRWRGAADLSGLRGRTVRLRFQLYRADLYSLRFNCLQ